MSMSAASVCGQDAEEIVEGRGYRTSPVPALDPEIAAAKRRLLGASEFHRYPLFRSVIINFSTYIEVSICRCTPQKKKINIQLSKSKKV